MIVFNNLKHLFSIKKYNNMITKVEFGKLKQKQFYFSRKNNSETKTKPFLVKFT